MSEDPRERPETNEPEAGDAEDTQGPAAGGRERAEDVTEKLKEAEEAAE